MVDQTQREAFIAVLRNMGGSAGHGSLREALKWDEATYSAVKEDQVRAGAVTPGRGRGGSIALTETTAQVERTLEQLLDQDVPATPPKRANSNGNGGDLGFEAELFKAADKLRGNMEPSDYKHVALGLI